MTTVEPLPPSFMSLQKCLHAPKAPKACLSNTNPSWSPAVEPEQAADVPSMTLESNSYHPYYLCCGQLIKHDEIISPQLLAAIQSNYYLIRQIKDSWWRMVEIEEEPFARPHDTFLCRQDHIEHEIYVKDPTEEELPTLTQKLRFIKNDLGVFQHKMGYFRSIWVTLEYGSTYDGNQRWTRHAIAYLKGDVSPYPFQKDCRPEHHKHE